jgi:hypothetical protein
MAREIMLAPGDRLSSPEIQGSAARDVDVGLIQPTPCSKKASATGKAFTSEVSEARLSHRRLQNKRYDLPI